MDGATGGRFTVCLVPHSYVPVHKAELGMFPGDVGAVTCTTVCTYITERRLSSPSLLHANVIEFRERVGDEEVSLGDSQELGNRLIHLNTSSNYIMILSLYLLMDFLTKIWWTLRIWHQTSMMWKLNFFTAVAKWLLAHTFYLPVSKKQLLLAVTSRLKDNLFCFLLKKAHCSPSVQVARTGKDRQVPCQDTFPVGKSIFRSSAPRCCRAAAHGALSTPVPPRWSLKH